MPDIDWFGKEITVDADGVSENAYEPGLSQVPLPSVELTAKLIDHFPEILRWPFPPIAYWNLIGITHANNVNYFESTISISPEGNVPRELLEYLNIPQMVIRPHSGYTLKFKLDSKQIILKTYDIAIEELKKFPWPAGIVPSMELGRHINDPKLTHLRDYYFSSEMSKEELEAAFGMTVPCVGEGRKIYGALYDVYQKKILKFKQYLYPLHDPEKDVIDEHQHALTHENYPYQARLEDAAARQRRAEKAR